MSRDDLLELAALDALCLLDEYESALYTRSYHHAPAAVQDEVKERQEQYAGDAWLLPEVEPRLELRERVLSAVARSIEDESVRLAPLATIGRARPGRGDVIARIGPGTSLQVWRAASFVLAAVALLFAYLGAQALERNEQLWNYAIDRGTSEEVDAIVGHDVMAIARDHRSRRVTLRPPTENATALATHIDASAHVIVLQVYDEETDTTKTEAALFASFLPRSGRYTLTARTEDGDVAFTRSFPTRDIAAGVTLRLSDKLGAMFASLTWEIADAQGNLLLTS